MEIAQVLGFTVVASLLVMSPGPNGILIAKTVSISGKVAGFSNIAGCVAAFFLHGSLSIFGISLILTQSAQTFQRVLKTTTGLVFIGFGAKLASLRS